MTHTKSLTLISLLSVVAVCALPSCSSVDLAAPASRAASGYASSSQHSKRKESAESSSYLNRPGLGTTAGYATSSSVESTAFFRKATGAPDAVDSFHYNDEDGAKAMLGADAASIDKHSGDFAAANDLLNVSLMHGYGDTRFPWLTSKQSPGRKVVVGSKGSSYSIHLENKTKSRMEVVASVDGIDVMDGKSASVKKHGYVLAGGQEMNIAGFRENNDTVRQFQFGSVRDSAAAKKGEAAARNVGVIGLAVWQEDKAAAERAARMEASQRTEANAFGGSAMTVR